MVLPGKFKRRNKKVFKKWHEYFASNFIKKIKELENFFKYKCKYFNLKCYNTLKVNKKKKFV